MIIQLQGLDILRFWNIWIKAKQSWDKCCITSHHSIWMHYRHSPWRFCPVCVFLYLHTTQCHVLLPLTDSQLINIKYKTIVKLYGTAPSAEDPHWESPPPWWHASGRPRSRAKLLGFCIDLEGSMENHRQCLEWRKNACIGLSSCQSVNMWGLNWFLSIGRCAVRWLAPDFKLTNLTWN